MNNFRPKTIYSRITLNPQDASNLKRFIGEELTYFNGLLSSLAAPIRSMASTIIKMDGRYEQLFGDIAATKQHPRNMTESTLGKIFQKYSDILFDKGKFLLDEKMSLIMNIATLPGNIHPDVRKNMAIAMLRDARLQSNAYLSTTTESGVYVQTITPMDARTKRHVQVPKNVLTYVTKDDHLAIKIPYISAPIVLFATQTPWNFAVVREELDGGHSIELTQENEPYAIRKADSSGIKRRKKRTDHNDTHSMAR